MGDPIEDILARLAVERVLEGVERLVAIPSVSGDEDAARVYGRRGAHKPG